MLRFTTHNSLPAERGSTKRQARIMAVVLGTCLAGALGPGLQPASTQASPARRMCVEAVGTCANLPQVAAKTQTPSSRPLQPTIRPSTTVDVTLTKRFLHIRGANFTPGKAVRIAVVNVSTWATVWTGPIYAQPALMDCAYPYLDRGCGQPNPQAGTIDYTVRLARRYGGSALVLLYHAARQTGSAAVKIQ